MAITRLYLKNFRCHEQLTLNFDSHHVLVGENGSGKTAILEAINLVTSPNFSPSRIKESDFCNKADEDIFIKITFDRCFMVKIPDGFVDQTLPCKSISLRIKHRSQASRGKLLTSGYVIEHWYNPDPYGQTTEIDSTLLPLGIELDTLPLSVATEVVKDDELRYTIKRKSGKDMLVTKRHLLINIETDGLPSVFYFDKKRENETKTGFNSLLSRIAEDLDWRYRKKIGPEHVRPLWENYYSSVIETVSDQKTDKILLPTIKRIRDFLGEEYFDLELSLLKLKEPFSRCFLSVRDGLDQVSLEGLGSGVSMMAAYCLLEQISEKSQNEVIFLIDEPEMHLHPQWQKKMHQHFSDANRQTIISTHSNFYIDLSKWSGITRLERSHNVYPNQNRLDEIINGQSLLEHLNDIPQFRHHQTVFQESDNEIFFAKKILLVEGPAEKYGLPKLGKLLNNQNWENLTIISCNGKTKIPYYSIICRAFDIPFFTVFDLDNLTTSSDPNSKIIAFAGESFFGFNSSFEKVLGIPSKATHKGSETLIKLDSFTSKEEIPQEVKECIEAINLWLS